ncbi:MAG: phenylalanine--tRNA ligase subunit beta [archaeon]|nr:phenylalanine--tRNA ligase subunit beta [archaeon]
MPTINSSKKDLESLVGKKFSQKELEDALMFVKGELDAINGDDLTIDVKETNMPDLWSTEGIARELRARMGIEKGIKKYHAEKARISCTIEKSVEKTRPFIACAIARNVKVTEKFLVQMIQLQEKVGMTYGRKRRETGIGIYDFDKMKPPIFYRGYKDNEIEFIPLEYRVKMRPSEILTEHPKGKEYAHLLKGAEFFPIVIDSAGVVASMPPIINSETTGKVTEKTSNIFIEVTGFNWNTVNVALKVMCMALADRGAKLEAVKINFPKTKSYPTQSIETPFFGTKKISLDTEYAQMAIGTKMNASQMSAILQKAGMHAIAQGKKIMVEYPDYRIDILHQADIVEDILIGHGYNNIMPQKVELSVAGEELSEKLFLDKARDVCIGLGLQEVLTFNLSSKEKQLEKIMAKDELVQIANPVSVNWEVMRKRIVPELLDFLAKNKHAEYPQGIFEIGTCLSIDKNSDTMVRQTYNLGIAISDSRANFTRIKSVLDAITKNLGIDYRLRETKSAFLDNSKAGDILAGKMSGFIGEISQKCAQNFSLETKTIVLEIELVQ